ncbi:MAG: shikimate dehydrogenase [Gammaproteobacteria bacterium]|nr:shikimate dehydrogenase [Gammaproteobacteria bacterium]
MNKKCAVIGNPIEHSLSPYIHSKFAQQFEMDLVYEKILATSDTFSTEVDFFFSDGGTGLNVTLPFKLQAYEICDSLTPVASRAKSVNTLLKDKKGRLIGDTTDGQGLLKDLLRLGLSPEKNSILILGAGGAARAILAMLLDHPCQLKLLNRTYENASRLVNELNAQDKVLLNQDSFQPDLIINTLSNNGADFLGSANIDLKPNCFLYDISYGERASNTLTAAKKLGIKHFADGWGMLVEQAALSFEAWHGHKPDTDWLITRGVPT